MRRAPFVGAFVLFLVVCIRLIPAHGLTGIEWMRFGEEGRFLYISGVADSWMNLYTMIAVEQEKAAKRPRTTSEDYFLRAWDCAQPMTGGQALAVVEKYMKDNPARWHHSMASTVAEAMAQACHK